MVTRGTIFVDLAAKQERNSSFWLPRQSVSMELWSGALPHLWMAFATDDSVPPFRGDHFDVRAPSLPPAALSPSLVEEARTRLATVQISLGTANVQ